MSYKEEIDLTGYPSTWRLSWTVTDVGQAAWTRTQLWTSAGAETVHVIAEEAAKLGVRYLTLYTFSTENWNRPEEESKR